MVPEMGAEWALIPGAPFLRQGLAGKLRAVAATAKGVVTCRRLLREMKAGQVIGFGGYATVPVVLAAASLGLRIGLYEANVEPGLGNRLLVRLADEVFLGMPSAFGGARAQVTGIPLAIERLPFEPGGEELRVLVAGGSAGSEFLNGQVPPLLKRLFERGWKMSVTHLAGAGNEVTTRARYAALGLRAEVIPFCREMAAVYARTDFAVICAGASTLTELAAFGIPALLVPLRVAAHQHQNANAAAYAAVAGVPWMREDDWREEKVACLLAALWANPERLAQMRRDAARWHRPEAAERIVDRMLGGAAEQSRMLA